MAYDILKDAQTQALKIIMNSHKKNRLAHAYIFEGEAGTKKFETALFFASTLLCEAEDKPCGECKQCKRINHLTHPNVYVIESSKQTINKDAIKDLQTEFNKTAVEDGAKIYIIVDADKMNAHASNALLKFFEEPMPNTHGILLTKNKAALLPTIRSRAQTIRFHSLSENVIYDTLVESGYDTLLARLASKTTHTITDAEAFLSTDILYDVIDLVKALYTAYTENESLPLTYKQDSFGLIKSKEDLIVFLDVLMHYQKDLIYGKMKHYKKQIFKDDALIIETVIETKTKAMLVEELDRMLTLKSRLNNYINDALAMDNLLILLERRHTHGE